jgi:SAM-dependent methyltransferase
MAETDVFKHSTPSIYDRYMGPLLFEPFARHVAERVGALRPSRILETAAGTGIVTRALRDAAPEATIVATDVNPAVVGFAAEQVQSERVEFQIADAQNLPFEDATFDVVVCLFGIMFFPDKIRANAEARRVLRPQGRYIVVAFDRLDLNPIPRAAGEAVASLFPEDPRYMERGPFSYTDAAVMEEDLWAAVRGCGGRDHRVVKSRIGARCCARDRARVSVPGRDRTPRCLRARAGDRSGRAGARTVGG